MVVLFKHLGHTIWVDLRHTGEQKMVVVVGFWSGPPCRLPAAPGACVVPESRYSVWKLYLVWQRACIHDACCYQSTESSNSCAAKNVAEPWTSSNQLLVLAACCCMPHLPAVACTIIAPLVREVPAADLHHEMQPHPDACFCSDTSMH
jgi:hypothetical protein